VLAYLRLRTFLSFVLTILMICMPVPKIGAAQKDGNPGQGQANRSDPCTHLPDPPGKAEGIDKKCPALGSSSGVARGDFNGDGVADLAIGVPGSIIGGKTNVGLVHVIYGSFNGLTTNTSGFPGPQTFSQATLGNLTGFPEPAAGDRFGTALASGDFDGDGYSDLAIGIPGKVISGQLFGLPSSMGAIVLVYGSANGLDLTRTSEFDITNAIAQRKITLPSLPVPEGFDFSKAQLGQSLAWGDFNYDGAADLVAGAPGISLTYLGVTFRSAVGGVWEILGARFFEGSVGDNTTLFTQSSIDPTLTDNTGDQFGYSLAGGDFNGDSADDIAIGVPYKAVGGLAEAGIIVVMAGAFPQGLDPGVGHNKLGEGSLAKTNDHFGIALAAGDFDGRGKAYLAIGTPNKAVGGVAQAGAVYEVPGPWQFNLADINNTTAREWDQNRLGGTAIAETGDHFGSALAANDFNGDGIADLAIGVPDEGVLVSGVNNVGAGEVDVIYGSPASCSPNGVSCIGGDLSTTAVRAPQEWTEASPTAGNRFGMTLTAWNFGRNEVTGLPPLRISHAAADLAVGMPYATVAGVSGAGAINVIYGSYLVNGLVSSGRQVLTQQTFGSTPQAGAHFGAAMY
jgi:hypothetical protein